MHPGNLFIFNWLSILFPQNFCNLSIQLTANKQSDYRIITIRKPSSCIVEMSSAFVPVKLKLFSSLYAL